MPIRNVLKALLRAISLYCLGCADPTKNGYPLTRYDSLMSLKSSFPYRNLAAYPSDSLTSFLEERSRDSMDANLFRLMLREDGRDFIGQGFNQDYPYAWDDRKDGLIAFTILTLDESSYCLLLKYYLFNPKGERTATFLIAAECGDGGWTFVGNGERVGENDFRLYTVDSDVYDWNPEAEAAAKHEIDSIDFRIHVHASGQATETQIRNVHVKE